MANCSRTVFYYPALQTNWVYQQSSKETLYNPGDPTKSTSSTTTYTYETTPVHYQVKSISRSTSEAGKTLISEFSYPADYTGVNSGVIAQMKGPLYMHNAVVETVQKVNTLVVGGNFTTYSLLTDVINQARALPTSLKVLQLRAPKTTFTTSLATGMAADSDYALKHTITYALSTLNIQEEQPSDGIPTAYLWSHNAKLPIAAVQNATASQAAFTSFEFGTNEGGWTYAGQPTPSGTTPGKTGASFYGLTAGNLSKALPGSPAGSVYRLSYWAQAGTVTLAFSPSGITVTDLPTSAADANGWVFYQKTFTLTAATTLTVSGTAIIDEARVHPLAAQMTTLTYDPLGGIRSGTDAANVTTYYEYDPLQRLQNVRDQDRRLLNNYRYHYRGLP